MTMTPNLEVAKFREDWATGCNWSQGLFANFECHLSRNNGGGIVCELPESFYISDG